MRSLTWKLSGAFLLIVLIGVGLTAYLINLNTTNEFRQYVSAGNMMYTASLAENIEDFYIEDQSWDDLQDSIDSYLTYSSQRLIVTNDAGKIIADTSDEWIGDNSDDIGLANGTPINSSGNTVGYLYVLTSGGMGRGRMGGNSPMVSSVDTEEEFLNKVNNSLWQVGLITGVIALIIGLILTRQIIRPIRTLISGARHISQGNLGHRIDVHSHDEIGELADSFNSMAASLEKGEQSRRQMTADIAHELRTPLTVIDGIVNGIVDDVFPPDQEHLSSIIEQTSSLTHLISDLRDISLAETGGLKLELSQTDIKELINKVVTGFQASAEEKGINLTFNAESRVKEIEIDSFRIEQVVSNLIRNAIRHVSSGGGIDVNLTDAGSGIIISVLDTGEGISADDLPHVFERFYRSGSSRSRENGGTGLGLAIVKQMTEAHGGNVSIESVPGKGATFRVFLPY